MHVEIDPHSVVGIGIVALRKEDKVGSKLRITEECLDTLDDVAKVYVVRLSTDKNFLALEHGPWRRQAIDEIIHLANGGI